MISQLKNEKGEWITRDNGLQEYIPNYFQGLYSSSRSGGEVILRNVQKRVIEAQNDFLLANFEAQEIKRSNFCLYIRTSLRG